ncbi:MAG: hypothetical protein KJ041_09455 [Gammaproteobacteria bacterium]|nr:hypothetical protein [Gammaproteobacteria bacterium]
MRLPSRFLAISLLCSMASLADAACEYPPAVKVPDGKAATKAEIEASGAEVKQYIATMEGYLACLDQEEAAVPEEQKTPDTRALHVKRYNAAVDAMQATAAEFNAQLRAFKATGK